LRRWRPTRAVWPVASSLHSLSKSRVGRARRRRRSREAETLRDSAECRTVRRCLRMADNMRSPNTAKQILPLDNSKEVLSEERMNDRAEIDTAVRSDPKRGPAKSMSAFNRFVSSPGWPRTMCTGSGGTRGRGTLQGRTLTAKLDACRAELNGFLPPIHAVVQFQHRTEIVEGVAVDSRGWQDDLECARLFQQLVRVLIISKHLENAIVVEGGSHFST
jgi:hypothetical protein